jgi:hypothetical protein
MAEIVYAQTQKQCNGIQHNKTQHMELNDAQHNNTQHKH